MIKWFALRIYVFGQGIKGLPVSLYFHQPGGQTYQGDFKPVPIFNNISDLAT